MSIPTPHPADGSPPEEWQSTRAETAVPTQVMPREEDEGEPDLRDIGRPVSPTQRELFVSCDPAEALQQQFDHLQPEFIALHDVGTSSSRKLLAGVAAALGRLPQKLIIRRQGYGTPLATIEFIELATADGGALRGAYVLAEADGDLDAIVIASGSEVHDALAARETLQGEGIGVRVVSMPSWDLFEMQDVAYREQVLPPGITARVSIEAGVTQGWQRWLGERGRAIGIDRFGASAPAKDLYQHFGLTAEAIVPRILEKLKK